MCNIKALIISMLKVGIIGFGGGNALIPVIEQETVTEKQMITKEEYDKDVIAATLTPGALPVEIASGIGLQSNGVKGMLAAGTAMALPGAFVTVLFLSVLLLLNEGILTQIQYASIGITSFIMCLLTQYILSTLQECKKPLDKVLAFSVITVVFFLTGMASLLGILHIDIINIPKLSTIHILLLTLLVSIAVGLTRKNKDIKNRKINNISLRILSQRLAIWFLFLMLLSLPAIVMVGNKAIPFEIHGLLSSVLSFGGGDAYLTIADGLFVPDYISEYDFYNNIVLIVNVLPGSILCKTLSGIGYVYGHAVTNSVLGGILMSIAGFACSVAASCSIFYIIYHLYDKLEHIYVFYIIRKTIRIVVSGLLITVMVNLIKAGMNINHNEALPVFLMPALIVVLYLFNMFVYHKFRCKNIVLIVCSLGLSVIICNVIRV